jgi:hypothetical protein
MEHHSLLKRLMAKRCDVCPPCRYARANPDTLFGKAMSLHGRFCPFWRAWQQVYGQPAVKDSPSASSATGQ